MVKPADEKLATLLAEDKDVVAARLFAASFAGDALLHLSLPRPAR